MRVRVESSRGFTLVESLVAMAMLVTAFAGLAQLIIMSSGTAATDWRRLVAVTAAQSKLEWLRARRLAFDAAGGLITDDALASSPPGSLERDVDGYCDVVDETGALVVPGGGGAVFVRRWSVIPAPAALETVAIEVCVFRWPAREGLRAAQACVATLRARQP